MERLCTICPCGDECRFAWTPFCVYVHSIDLEHIVRTERQMLTTEYQELLHRYEEMKDELEVLQMTHKRQYLNMQQMRQDLAVRDKLLQQQNNTIVLTTATRDRANDRSLGLQRQLDAVCQENSRLRDELAQCYSLIGQFAQSADV